MWLQTLWLKYFSKIYQSKCLKPKNKGHSNFYECCELTKKIIPCSSMRSLSFWIMGKERGLLSKNIHCLILLLSTRWCFYHIMHSRAKKMGCLLTKLGRKNGRKWDNFGKVYIMMGCHTHRNFFFCFLVGKKIWLCT